MHLGRSRADAAGTMPLDPPVAAPESGRAAAVGWDEGGRRADVQGLRGVAVLLVVAYHAGLPIPGGWVGVDVFFVISGYVIGRLLLGELARSGRLDLGSFLARRARRLLPALTLMTVVALALGALLRNPSIFGIEAARSAVAASAYVANIYLYRHTGYFGPSADATNPFLHTWSLSVEEQLYLLFPVFLAGCWLLGRRRRPLVAVRLGIVAVSVGSFALAAVLTATEVSTPLEVPHRFAFFMLPTRAWEFGVGALLATTTLVLGRRAGRLAGVVGSGLVLVAALSLDGVAPFASISMLLPVGGAALLLLGGSGSRGPSPLSWRPLTWIGDRSYSWYLWHWPLIAIGRTVLADTTAVSVALGVGSLVPAALAYRFVELRYWKRPDLVGWRAGRLVAVCLLASVGAGTIAGVAAYRSWGVERPQGWYERPAGIDEGCHILNRDFVNDASTACVTGRGRAGGTVMVLGAEQANVVAAGVRIASARLDLEVVQWTRSGCPFLVGAAPADYPQCAEWNEEARALVDRVHPDVVVLGNCGTCFTDPGSEAPIVLRDHDRPASRAEALDDWQAALTATFDWFADRGVSVVTVEPGPDFGSAFPRDRLSILRPRIDVPTLDRAAVERAREGVLLAERRAAARSRAEVRTLDPVDAFCDEVCRPVRDGAWIYQDRRNLNRLAAEQLGPGLETTFADLLG